MKNYSDTIGNQTRDLPTCSAVSQPTALPRAPFLIVYCSEITCDFLFSTSKCKGKAVPLQAWSGPEGSRKLTFPDFITTAQGVGSVVSVTNRPHLPPGNSPGTHFC